MKKENGNVFLAIFGAVAMVGIIGGGIMSFSKGPVQTAVNLTRKNTAQAEMSIAGQVAIMASTNAVNKGDCDSDNFVEPPEWRAAGAAPLPVNGGLIPNAVAVAKKDPWGTDYGYCAWDHGPTKLDATCQGAPGVNKRLQGTNSKIYPVIAIISAGPDKIFTTTCRNFTTGTDRADQNNDGDLEDVGDFPLVSKAATTDDDLISTYSYEGAMSSSGGLWSLKSSDAGTAYIDKKIEALGAAISGMGTFERLAATGGDYVDITSGLKLADPTVITTCNATNINVMRRAAAGYGIEICNGTSWGAPGGAASNIDDLSDASSGGNSLFGGKNAGNGNITFNNTGFGVSALASVTTGKYMSALGNQSLAAATSNGYGATAIGYRAAASTVNANYVTAIGYEALASCAGNCVGNTVAGYQAAKFMTGGYTTVAGSQALMSNVTGQFNSVAGTRAAKSMTLGEVNSIVGYEAGMNSTQLDDNVLVGANVMSTGTGSNNKNTFIGYNAAKAANGMTNNVGIGSGSMELAQTGSFNVAIGNATLAALTTGSENTLIGIAAGSTGNPSGLTGVGAYALSNTTGVRNTGVGYYAGSSITSGTDNTAMGRSTLTLLLGAGSHNTAAGSYAMDRASATSMRSTAAGASAMGNSVGTFIDSVAIGYGALAGAGTTGSTAVGYQAAAISTGSNNTAIGNNTLKASSTGANNTAIGNNAGSSSLTDSDSTFVGEGAGKMSVDSGITAVGMYALLDGAGVTQTVAIGYQALTTTGAGNSNTCIGPTACSGAVGANNVAIGSLALRSNSTSGASGSVAIGGGALRASSAAKNTGFGFSSLVANTSGYQNTGFGSSSLYKVQTGNNNTAIGSESLSSVVSGNNNTALGNITLNKTTTSSMSVAIGFNASGNMVSGGDRNTAIGFNALSGLTSGSSNIAIGNGILTTGPTRSGTTAIGQGVAVSNGLTNVTALGRGATVFGSNTVRLGDANVTLIAGQVAFVATSDKRVKKDIQPTDLGLDFILKLKPVSYRMIDGNGRLDYGFLAQDVEKALEGRKTNMVTRKNDKMGTYRMRGEDLLSPIVRAVQEQQTTLENLEKELDSVR